jgi:hypothetical protein
MCFPIVPGTASLSPASHWLSPPIHPSKRQPRLRSTTSPAATSAATSLLRPHHLSDHDAVITNGAPSSLSPLHCL